MTENQTLRDLARALRDADLRIFREFLAEEFRWFEKEGHVEEASSRRALVPAVLTELGDGAVQRLLAGVPISVRPSDTSPPVRNRLLALLRQTNPQLLDATDQVVSEHTLVIILSRSPHDARGSELIVSFVEPSGFRWARLGGFSRPPGWRFPTAALRSFALPPPDPADSSRPITVNLSPVEPGGQGIRQDLDDVLKLLAEAVKTPIVADGYLRPKVAFPANLIANEYPRDQLLQVVATTWGCSFRFSKHGVVLFRGRDWWLDDAADVPETDLRWVRETFGAGRMVTFDSLLRLSTFSTPQLHRLRDAGLIPAAQGLVVPFFFDESGGRAVLRFVAGLPDAERRRVLSASGLRLKEAPAELVRQHLYVAAATHAGVADPAAQLELMVRILPSPSGRGFRIELFDDSGRPRAARWSQDVGL